MGGLDLFLAPVIVVIVLAVLGFVGVRAWVFARQRQTDEIVGPGIPSLEYVVPDGQDPVVVLTALSADGYTATTDPAAPNLVHIACPAGLDRERPRVRATIQHAGVTAVDTGVPFEPDQVRFVDET
jgi:hypothetical protein